MHKVWLYAPGENASKWDVCLSQNIMCIGWDEMGNLLEYASKKEMAARLQEIYDKPEASFKNDSLALWEFAHEMQAGDIVIVKKGQNQIIGRGIVEGDYAFDESFSDFKNVRKMQWTNAGEWENIGKNVQKTLTDIMWNLWRNYLRINLKSNIGGLWLVLRYGAFRKLRLVKYKTILFIMIVEISEGYFKILLMQEKAILL